MPLATRVELAKQIDLWHYDSLAYNWNVVCRMTGHNTYESFYVDRRVLFTAEEQFKKALKDDDSLFVEEEHNLFVDEVRETELWCGMFEKKGLRNPVAYTKRIWGMPDTILAEWVLHGLESLNRLLDKEDGPLGWSSRPAVFAVCMRILLSANSILRRQENIRLEVDGRDDTKEPIFEDIITALQHFVALGRKRKVHERLLFEAEGRPNSPLYKLL